MGTLYNNNLPTVTHTLDQFMQCLNNFFVDGDTDAFIKAGLTGKYHNKRGNRKQIFVNPLLNNVSNDY